MADIEERRVIQGVKRRQSGAGPWRVISLLLAVLLMVVLLMKFPRGEAPGEGSGEIAPEDPSPSSLVPAPDPVRVPEEVEPPVPRVVRVQSSTDIQALSKDLDFKISLNAEVGGLATAERADRDSYAAEYRLSLRVPTAARTVEDLKASNDALFEILPGLEAMLPSATVSPWFGQLYLNKTERLRKYLRRLDQLLTRHNMFDCQTMLNLTHAESDQKVFLMQAEMDVVSDGSDGDRLAEMPDDIVNSTNYQPFTSYGWRKTTKTPNPMVAGWEKRIANADRELKAPGTTAERKSWLRERKIYLERGVQDMKSRSYLVADYDPFVVMPVNVITDREDPFAPNVGDYVAVIIGEKVFPAIVGDGGPSFKVGEASLRLAKAVDARANPYRRPVSDLTVTYVVFPRSAEIPWRAPDYEHWRKRCAELLEKVGGLGPGYKLHQWEDLFPKPETSEEEHPESEASPPAGTNSISDS